MQQTTTEKCTHARLIEKEYTQQHFLLCISGPWVSPSKANKMLSLLVNMFSLGPQLQDGPALRI